jgi:type VI secretion system protein ImpH
MADLIEQLRDNGREFGFFQAVRLLEEYFRTRDGDGSPMTSGRIRFVADPSIAFPGSDVSAVTCDDEVVRMWLSFSGLLGVDSPLPNYFADYIARYPDSAGALSDFCAIFNNRLYAFFFEAFRKYRFSMALRTDALLNRISALNGHSCSRGGDAFRMCAYTGMLSTRRRSARGLATMLSDFFNGVPVGVSQWVPRRVSLPDPSALGGDAALGVNTMLGTEIIDYSGKFRVFVGPLRRETFESFLDGTENLAKMKTLVESYMTDPLAFDIEVRLAPSDLVPVILGEGLARLGQTTSLGRCADGATGGEFSVVLPGAE